MEGLEDDGNNFVSHMASKILYQEFCDLCEKIKNAKTKNSKVDILQKYIHDFRSRCNSEDGTVKKDFFPILRLLLPQTEKERTYGIKETKLAKMYIRALNLSKNSDEAKKLLNFKAPTSSQMISADFGDVAFYILKSRCPNVSAVLTIQEVNEGLDKIALYHAENKPRSVDDELTKFVTKMNALQQKWLIRVILKDLKLGIGQQKMLYCYHADASDLFDSCNSLSKVCGTLHDTNVRLNEIDIEMFSPFRPMLSEKLDITNIKKAIRNTEEFYMETKFDGERFQMHMKNNKFKYFSRNGYDFTDNYGSSFESSGLLTKYLKDVLDSSVCSFILDGEMMGWHKTKNRFGSKGMTYDIKKMSVNSTYRPCFCVFDILLQNDVILTNLPLSQRMEFMDRLFKNKEGVIIHSLRRKTKSIDEVLGFLNEAIENDEEGIILKSVNSLYKPNVRKAGWFKIKPEYTEGAMTELDMLIIGGYYSENKRHGLVSSVMLGLAVPPQSEGSYPSVFHSVGRVKLSVSNENLEDLCNRLQPHWKIVNKTAPPPESLCWTKDKPDLWIEPQNSIVLQIKASELARTNVFKAEYTLRFPRIVKIRTDKPWYSSMTTEEFSEMTKDTKNIEKLTARSIGRDELKDLDVSPKKRSRILEVAPQFKPVELMDVQESSSLYAGKEICIMTGNTQISKGEIEKLIVENGGKFVQNPGPSTYCIIAGTRNVRVNNIINCSSYNVASAEWFLSSLKPEYVMEGKLPKWTPRDLYGTSNELTKEFLLNYDQFGDSYTQKATMESLKYSMKRVEEINGSYSLLPVEMEFLDKELFQGKPNPYSFMRMCNIYFLRDIDPTSEVEHRKANITLELLIAEFLFFGGFCCDQLIDGEVTHVVVPSFVNKTKLDEVREKVNSFTDKPFVLSVQWLETCFKRKMSYPEVDFVFV